MDSLTSLQIQRKIYFWLRSYEFFKSNGLKIKIILDAKTVAGSHWSTILCTFVFLKASSENCKAIKNVRKPRQMLAILWRICGIKEPEINLRIQTETLKNTWKIEKTVSSLLSLRYHYSWRYSSFHTAVTLHGDVEHIEHWKTVPAK